MYPDLFESFRNRLKISSRLGIDTRTLEAFRISLGFIVLVDLFARSLDLVAFYTDRGVLPRELLFEHYSLLQRVSIHSFSGDFWFQILLFLIAGVFAVALIIGYRTRLAVVFTFVLLVSAHARNPHIMNSGDALLTRLTFWSIFLPLGKRWSVDALRKRDYGTDGDSEGFRVTSLATAGLLIQVVLVYAVNAVFKLRSDTWKQGEAVSYILNIELYTTPLGDFLSQYNDLLVSLNYLWMALLVSSVLLIVLTGWLRFFLVSLFVGTHLGMFLTMYLDVFPLISIVSLVPFIPAKVWETRILGLVEEKARKPIKTNFEKRFRWVKSRDVGTDSVPDLPDSVGTYLVQSFLAVVLVLMLVFNAASVGYVETPESVEPVKEQVHNKWSLFAPFTPKTEKWYVNLGQLQSGRSVDIFHDSPPEWDSPPKTAFPNSRWRKYYLKTRKSGKEYRYKALVDYLCRNWNSRHEDRVERIEIHYVWQVKTLDYTGPTNTEKLYEGGC